MKNTIVVFSIMGNCLFAQFPPYDPFNPNPTQLDIERARNYARDQEQKAMATSMYDAASLEAQEQQRRARDAARDALRLEEQMRMKQMRELQIRQQQELLRQQQDEELMRQSPVGRNVERSPTIQAREQNVRSLTHAEEPKVEQYCFWDVTALNCSREKLIAKKKFIDAYTKWSYSIGCQTTRVRLKAERLFDAYAKDYNDGLFLTMAPQPEDYQDKSRFFYSFYEFSSVCPQWNND